MTPGFPLHQHPHGVKMTTVHHCLVTFRGSHIGLNFGSSSIIISSSWVLPAKRIWVIAWERSPSKWELPTLRCRAATLVKVLVFVMWWIAAANLRSSESTFARLCSWMNCYMGVGNTELGFVDMVTWLGNQSIRSIRKLAYAIQHGHFSSNYMSLH